MSIISVNRLIGSKHCGRPLNSSDHHCPPDGSTWLMNRDPSQNEATADLSATIWRTILTHNEYDSLVVLSRKVRIFEAKWICGLSIDCIGICEKYKSRVGHSDCFERKSFIFRIACIIIEFRRRSKTFKIIRLYCESCLMQS